MTERLRLLSGTVTSTCLAAGLLGVLAACISRPPASLRPAGERLSTPSFSGQYCFGSVSQSTRAHLSGTLRIRLLPVAQIREHSVVTVNHLPDGLIEFRFTDQAGDVRQSILDLTGRHVSSARGRLQIQHRQKPTGGPRFGIGTQQASEAVYRMADGRLILEGKMKESGLALGFLPFSETHLGVLELTPLTGLACPLPSDSPSAGTPPISGTYSFTLCATYDCAAGDSASIHLAGTLVLAGDTLREVSEPGRRWHRRARMYSEQVAPNGCIAVTRLNGRVGPLSGISSVGLIRWRLESADVVPIARVLFELSHPPDTRYHVTALAVHGTLKGSGSPHGFGLKTRGRRVHEVVARRLGPPNPNHCRAATPQ